MSSQAVREPEEAEVTGKVRIKIQKKKKRENVEIISEAVYMDQTHPHHPAVR